LEYKKLTVKELIRKNVFLKDVYKLFYHKAAESQDVYRIIIEILATKL